MGRQVLAGMGAMARCSQSPPMARGLRPCMVLSKPRTSRDIMSGAGAAAVREAVLPAPSASAAVTPPAIARVWAFAVVAIELPRHSCLCRMDNNYRERETSKQKSNYENKHYQSILCARAGAFCRCQPE